jgi:flagellar capping protein FliD
MEDYADILERELSDAVEVKNPDSLHRYIKLMVNTMVERKEYQWETAGLRSDIKSLTESMNNGFKLMEERFKRVDERFEQVDNRFEQMQKQMDQRFEQVERRFEQVDKRFEDINHRFNQMFAFITVGFTVLATITVLFKFIG